MQINISNYFLNSVNLFPNSPAVSDDDLSLNYEELFWAVNNVLKSINSISDFKNEPIVVLIPKSVLALVAIHAITLSGNIYVPVDVAMPTERLRKIIRALNPTLIICSAQTIHLANDLIKADSIINLGEIDFSNDCVEDLTASIKLVKSKLSNVIDTDPAYVIFTSGSTGDPKGVVISHRSVIDYIEWAKAEYKITPEDRIASQAPFYFDNSTLDIFLSLSSGACLHIPSQSTFLFPSTIIDYLNEKRITVIFWVPSVLISVANSKILNNRTPKYLKMVLFAGEQMPVNQINTWVDALPPGTLFSNLYGPTEITVDCTFYSFKEKFDGEILPIGFPCRNTDVFILSEAGNKVKSVGEIGELCVRGSSLALGYWNNPEQTESVFIQNPLQKRYRDLIYKTGDLVKFDLSGRLLYVGRKDGQVKHQGYRIEIGEIESAILNLKYIENACVLYDAKTKEIIAFVKSIREVDLTLSKLRFDLSQALPKYMLPNAIKQIDLFPLNSSGKIDRKKLRR